MCCEMLFCCARHPCRQYNDQWLYSVQTHSFNDLEGVENDQDGAGIADIFLVSISQLRHDPFERLNMKQLNELDPLADLHTGQIVRKPSLCSHTYSVQRDNLKNTAFGSTHCRNGEGEGLA